MTVVMYGNFWPTLQQYSIGLKCITIKKERRVEHALGQGSRLIYWKIGLPSALYASLYNNGRYLQTLEVKGRGKSQHRQLSAIEQPHKNRALLSRTKAPIKQPRKEAGTSQRVSENGLSITSQCLKVIQKVSFLQHCERSKLLRTFIFKGKYFYFPEKKIFEQLAIQTSKILFSTTVLKTISFIFGLSVLFCSLGLGNLFSFSRPTYHSL